VTPERQPAPVGAASYLPSPSVHSYRTLATEHEALMQKYLHLLQIVETEKTVAKQLRQQIEDGEVEIERLKAEVTATPGAEESGQGSQPPTSHPGSPGSGRHRVGRRDPLPATAMPAPNLKSVMLAQWKGRVVRSGFKAHPCLLTAAT